MIHHKSPNPAPNAPVLPVRQRLTPRALLEVKRLSDPQIHPDGQRIAFVVEEADFDDSRMVSHLWLTERLAEEGREIIQGSEEREEEREASEVPAAGFSPPKIGGRGGAHAEREHAQGEGDTGEGEAEEEPSDLTRQLTYSHDGESMPRWSPDGRYLAFLSERVDTTEAEDEDEEPKPQVWILPIDGGEARKITATKEGVIDYAWTPDSSALIYLAPEPRPKPIESLRKEERDRRKIDPTVEQGDRLRRQFWSIEIEAGKPKLLYTGDHGIEEFVLAPDGERLCYATNYSGDWNDYHQVDLWILSLGDASPPASPSPSDPRQTFKLVERAGGKTHPRWSPDGKQIAFLSWLDPQLSYSRQCVFVVDAPSTPSAAQEPRLMAADYDYDLTDLEWSVHDGCLYAVATIRTGSEIVRIQEGRVERLRETIRVTEGTTERLEDSGAAYRQDIGVDPAGTALVYVREMEAAFPEIWLRDEQGEIHALTKLNADISTRYLLPRQETVQWNGADGLSIEGVLTYPLYYEEGVRYPLVVQIHGGPKSHAVNTLQNYCMAPVWSAEGYAVLQPNYRGSEGYGNAFAVANRRDLGGGDFADIMAGVDWCIAQGIADPERLGVMGGSYGGFLTNWAIGHTDRFAAAISMFGIFHLQTDYSNSELSRWDNEYLSAYYWEDPDIYHRLSPGSYVANIHTPTLILHGDEDNNTFISNSKELYQALRHRGVTTEFVHYPREGHGLNEPNHRLDEIRRCLAWMDRYVRHKGAQLALYRVGDKVPHANGRLELCVVSAEITDFAGRQNHEESALLEIVATIYNLDPRQVTDPITLLLSDIRLEATEPGATPLTPVGIPLDLHGVKVLVEGENMRITQHPSADTGQLGFAFGVVFRTPKTGDCQLRIADFPVVSVHWTADEEHPDATEPN